MRLRRRFLARRERDGELLAKLGQLLQRRRVELDAKPAVLGDGARGPLAGDEDLLDAGALAARLDLVDRRVHAALELGDFQERVDVEQAEKMSDVLLAVEVL